MKISIGGYSFCNTIKEGKMDTFGYLETSRFRYGLSAVDLWNGTFERARDDIFSLPDEDYIRKLREAIDEKEMTVVNIAVDGAHLWDADPEKRKMLYGNAVAYMHIASKLGARTIRIDTGDHGSLPGSEEQFEYAAARFLELSKLAAELGMTVGPENHMGTSKDPNYLKRLAEAVDHPSFGILLHMGRWAVDEEIGDSLIAPWVYHTHFDGRTAATDKGERLVAALLDAGYDGYWGIEYNAPGNQYLEMEWAIASVKRTLTKARSARQGG